MEETDVVICGCGPTGAMLSTLLGRYSIVNVVLERDSCITRDPRGIALDEDGIRHLQASGIYDQIFTDIGECEFHARLYTIFTAAANFTPRHGQVQVRGGHSQ